MITTEKVWWEKKIVRLTEKSYEKLSEESLQLV